MQYLHIPGSFIFQGYGFNFRKWHLQISINGLDRYILTRWMTHVYDSSIYECIVNKSYTTLIKTCIIITCRHVNECFNITKYCNSKTYLLAPLWTPWEISVSMVDSTSNEPSQLKLKKFHKNVAINKCVYEHILTNLK